MEEHDPLRSTSRPRLIFIAVLLAGAVLLVYSPVLGPGVEFVKWDDDIVVTDNPHIRELSWPSVKWMFTDAQWTLRYMPLSWINWAIRYRLFGMNARAFHAGGVVLHAANALLVLMLVRALVPKLGGTRDASERVRDFASASAAAAWALHPLRVETVAWVTHERFALATFFALLGALSYLRSDGMKDRWYWITTAFIWAAALAHPIAMPLPAILLVADLCPLRRRAELRPASKRIIRLAVEKIPMSIAPIFVGVMTMAARATPQGGIWAPPPTFQQFDLLHRVAQAIYVFAYYIWRPLVPFHLSPVYTTLLDFKPFEPRFLASAALLLGVGAFCFFLRRRMPGLLALFACHILILIPVTGFAEHPHWTSDRYSYEQSILTAVAVAWVIAFAWMRLASLRQLMRIAVVGVIACGAIMSFRLASTWHDSAALFEHILTELAGHPYREDIHWRLGEAYLKQDRFAAAAAQADATLKLNPNSFHALSVKGVAEIELRHPEQATSALQRAVTMDPLDPTARRMLGVALASGGRLDDAERELRKSISLLSTSPESHYWLAEVLLQKRDPSAARAELLESLRLDPTYRRARDRLAQMRLAAP